MKTSASVRGLLVIGLACLLGSVASSARAQSGSPDGEDQVQGQVSYDPQGRRDPFRPLTGEATSDEERAKYRGTLRGLLWTEVKLTSILGMSEGDIAMFEGGPDKKGYFAREGDRFWNGSVHKVDPGSSTVTIREQLDDPRLLKPYRDWVIQLHGTLEQP